MGTGSGGDGEESTGSGAGVATHHGETGAACLVLLTGEHLGRRHRLGDDTVIGRAPDVDIVLEDPEVSRRHARIRDGADGFVLEDLDSRNGTAVNGLPLEGIRLLQFGDRIQLGSCAVLLFTHQDPLEERVLQRQKLDAIGRLGAGIAHDFNNLLSAVVSSAEHLESLPGQTLLEAPEVRETIADVRAASQHAVELTRRLVLYARRESGTDSLVDLSSLCEDVLALVQRTFGKATAVVADLEPSLRMRGDRAALHQLMMNLCLNAHDAMPDGGALTVRLARIEPERTPARAVGASRGRALLEVVDTGVGMDAETRARAFEPFFTTKTHQAGAGLGLSTVFQVATSHGGHVEIGSDPDQGTTVRVYLPLEDVRVRKAAPTPHGSPAASRAVRSHATILLVDDEPLVRRSAGRLLRGAGYRVLFAADGQEAVQSYGNIEPKPDLVILDLDMPVMSGDVAFERLRALDPGVRVLFISGHWEPEREQSLREAGAIEVLRKPYDGDTLRGAVARALGASRGS